MPYQHFTKPPIQLITYNDNYFITYFRNQNQNLLLKKVCTDPTTHHKRCQPPRHKCRHTLPETLPSPTFDLFFHPPHQHQIRWCRTHYLRELSFLRKEGHPRVWTRSKKGSSRANSWIQKVLVLLALIGVQIAHFVNHILGLVAWKKKKKPFFKLKIKWNCVARFAVYCGSD